MIKVPRQAARLTREIEGWLEFCCPERALEKLEGLTRYPGARPAYLLLKIHALRDLAEYEQALEQLEELREFHQDPEFIELTQAWCLKRLDRVSEAAECMRRLIEQQPRSAIAHFNLGCYLALLGDADAAIDALTFACGLDPRFREHLEGERDLESLAGMAGFEALRLPSARE